MASNQSPAMSTRKLAPRDPTKMDPPSATPQKLPLFRNQDVTVTLGQIGSLTQCMKTPTPDPSQNSSGLTNNLSLTYPILKSALSSTPHAPFYADMGQNRHSTLSVHKENTRETVNSKGSGLSTLESLKCLTDPSNNTPPVTATGSNAPSHNITSLTGTAISSKAQWHNTTLPSTHIGGKHQNKTVITLPAPVIGGKYQKQTIINMPSTDFGGKHQRQAIITIPSTDTAGKPQSKNIITIQGTVIDGKLQNQTMITMPRTVIDGKPKSQANITIPSTDIGGKPQNQNVKSLIPKHQQQVQMMTGKRALGPFSLILRSPQMVKNQLMSEKTLLPKLAFKTPSKQLLITHTRLPSQPAIVQQPFCQQVFKNPPPPPLVQNTNSKSLDSDNSRDLCDTEDDEDELQYLYTEDGKDSNDANEHWCDSSPDNDHNYSKCCAHAGQLTSTMECSQESVHHISGQNLETIKEYENKKEIVSGLRSETFERGRAIMVVNPVSENVEEMAVSWEDKEKYQKTKDTLECVDAYNASLNEHNIEHHQALSESKNTNNSCEWRIESVYSLAPEDDRSNSSTDTASSGHSIISDDPQENHMEQCEIDTFSLTDLEWKEHIKPCFVVLERLALSNQREQQVPDNSPRCSQYCRIRTLDMMCNLNLLNCEGKTRERSKSPQSSLRAESPPTISSSNMYDLVKKTNMKRTSTVSSPHALQNIRAESPLSNLRAVSPQSNNRAQSPQCVIEEDSLQSIKSSNNLYDLVKKPDMKRKSSVLSQYAVPSFRPQSPQTNQKWESLPTNSSSDNMYDLVKKADVQSESTSSPYSLPSTSPKSRVRSESPQSNTSMYDRVKNTDMKRKSAFSSPFSLPSMQTGPPQLNIRTDSPESRVRSESPQSNASMYDRVKNTDMKRKSAFSSPFSLPSMQTGSPQLNIRTDSPESRVRSESPQSNTSMYDRVKKTDMKRKSTALSSNIGAGSPQLSIRTEFPESSSVSSDSPQSITSMYDLVKKQRKSTTLSPHALPSSDEQKPSPKTPSLIKMKCENRYDFIRAVQQLKAQVSQIRAEKKERKILKKTKGYNKRKSTGKVNSLDNCITPLSNDTRSSKKKYKIVKGKRKRIGIDKDTEEFQNCQNNLSQDFPDMSPGQSKEIESSKPQNNSCPKKKFKIIKGKRKIIGNNKDTEEIQNDQNHPSQDLIDTILGQESTESTSNTPENTLSPEPTCKVVNSKRNRIKSDEGTNDIQKDIPSKRTTSSFNHKPSVSKLQYQHNAKSSAAEKNSAPSPQSQIPVGQSATCTLKSLPPSLVDRTMTGTMLKDNIVSSSSNANNKIPVSSADDKTHNIPHKTFSVQQAGTKRFLVPSSTAKPVSAANLGVVLDSLSNHIQKTPNTVKIGENNYFLVKIDGQHLLIKTGNINKSPYNPLCNKFRFVTKTNHNPVTPPPTIPPTQTLSSNNNDKPSSTLVEHSKDINLVSIIKSPDTNTPMRPRINALPQICHTPSSSNHNSQATEDLTTNITPPDKKSKTSESSTSGIKRPLGRPISPTSVMEELKRRKRRKLEAKYPLPPGVIIKSEPITTGYDLDSNWSVTSEIDMGFVQEGDLDIDVTTPCQSSEIFRNEIEKEAGRQENRNDHSQDWTVELGAASNYDDDLPPMLEKVSPTKGPASTTLVDVSDKEAPTPPALPPMLSPPTPSSSSLSASSLLSLLSSQFDPSKTSPLLKLTPPPLQSHSSSSPPGDADKITELDIDDTGCDKAPSSLHQQSSPTLPQLMSPPSIPSSSPFSSPPPLPSPFKIHSAHVNPTVQNEKGGEKNQPHNLPLLSSPPPVPSIPPFSSPPQLQSPFKTHASPVYRDTVRMEKDSRINQTPPIPPSSLPLPLLSLLAPQLSSPPPLIFSTSTVQSNNSGPVSKSKSNTTTTTKNKTKTGKEKHTKPKQAILSPINSDSDGGYNSLRASSSTETVADPSTSSLNPDKNTSVNRSMTTNTSINTSCAVENLGNTNASNNIDTNTLTTGIYNSGNTNLSKSSNVSTNTFSAAKSKIERLKELLKKKEKDVDNLLKIQSQVTQLDLDSL